MRTGPNCDTLPFARIEAASKARLSGSPSTSAIPWIGSLSVGSLVSRPLSTCGSRAAMTRNRNPANQTSKATAVTEFKIECSYLGVHNKLHHPAAPPDIQGPKSKCRQGCTRHPRTASTFPSGVLPVPVGPSKRMAASRGAGASRASVLEVSSHDGGSFSSPHAISLLPCPYPLTVCTIRL